MQLREGKDMLIKYYISRDINAPGCYIKAFEPLVQIAIAEKNALFGSESQLMIIVWP